MTPCFKHHTLSPKEDTGSNLFGWTTKDLNLFPKDKTLSFKALPADAFSPTRWGPSWLPQSVWESSPGCQGGACSPTGPSPSPARGGVEAKAACQAWRGHCVPKEPGPHPVLRQRAHSGFPALPPSSHPDPAHKRGHTGELGVDPHTHQRPHCHLPPHTANHQHVDRHHPLPLSLGQPARPSRDQHHS